MLQEYMLIISVEAVARSCSLKNVFLKISQNLHKITCVGVRLLIKWQPGLFPAHLRVHNVQSCINSQFPKLSLIFYLNFQPCSKFSIFQEILHKEEVCLTDEYISDNLSSVSSNIKSIDSYYKYTTYNIISICSDGSVVTYRWYY